MALGALSVIGRRFDPLGASRREVRRRKRIVGADRRQVGAREPEQDRGDQARPVLTAHAVHDDGAVRVRDRRKRLAEPVAKTLEEVDIRPRVVICDVVRTPEMRVELGDVLLVIGLPQHRYMDDLDLDLTRRVLSELSGQRRSMIRLTPCSASERQPASVSERTLSERTIVPERVCNPSSSGSPPRSRTFRQPSQTSEVN